MLFLRSVRMALVVSISIPASVLTALSLMYLSGLSVNMMSLGGLALGVGMLVDNAIVVIENIFRHRAAGSDPQTASIVGAGEVSAAITSSTFTSVAVFGPLIFVVGIAGQIFRELSLTVIFSLVASLLVAVSLIPRLAAAAPPPAAGPGRFDTALQSWGFHMRHWFTDLLMRVKPRGMRFDIRQGLLYQFYAYALGRVIMYRGRFLLGMLGLFLLCLFAGSLLDRQFLPKIDQGQFMIEVDLPVGTNLAVTNRVTRRIETELAGLGEVRSRMTQVGSMSEKAIESLRPYQAQIVVTLYRALEEIPPAGRVGMVRLRSTAEFISMFRGRLRTLNLEGAAIVFSMQDSMFSSIASQSAPIMVEIKGPDMDMLTDYTRMVTDGLRDIPGVVNITDDRPLPAPEITLQVDKDKASTVNLSVTDIARAGLIGIKGMVASSFKEDGIEYDIRVRLAEKDRRDIASLEYLLVHSPAGFNLPVKEVARVVSGKGPSQIRRVDQRRTITITADMEGTTLKTAGPKVYKLLEEINKKANYTGILTGEAEKIRESFTSLFLLLLLSVVVVYMIMAAQFESFIQPCIILFTIPLALIGAVAALFATNSSINAISLMGFIILAGIVVNNGIVLIDYANQLVARSAPVTDAIQQACATRFRPIMMTMTTTVLGLLPLALGLGEGAELRSPMAITVIGGLLVSTILTLGVIPALYVLLSGRPRHTDKP